MDYTGMTIEEKEEKLEASGNFKTSDDKAREEANNEIARYVEELGQTVAKSQDESIIQKTEIGDDTQNENPA